MLDVSALSDFLTQPGFWWGVPLGAVVTGVIAPLITARSVRASDARKATQEREMLALKAEQDEKAQVRKEAREDQESNRKIIRETATAFGEVCSAILEKAMDNKSIFNAVMDAALTMEGMPDKKALDKIEYSIDLMDETKKLTTAYNNLRVVAPVSLLRKATALNAAIMALVGATTMPLKKPPLMNQAGKAFDEFTNAVRAELGLDAYTAEDVERSKATYLDALQKQVSDYIKETQDEARRFGFLEPGSVPITTIQAGDLTEEHVGKFVGCHDPASGFNYGAKILKVIRVEEGSRPGMLVRIQHPPIPGGKPAHQERMRLRFEHEVQLVDLPDLKRPNGSA
ncbi:hypothetical protein Mkiyose1665_53220 [Mycobacterium kiyosense]|uniref:Uncharacterized protein n=1 Tax=Mycobacterium kiyosense TaxID=2871094 RepID=A0A9P3Q8G2_9MYCO|nr:hypothetical protein IWGMT90018_05990 [Mycobacterium kiyosense]BDE11987.1 hypothetical protein MKCMC460_08470 [Mycobacterium sp. 20KCMC460]GLB85184.1 hypothetical protein SRL2020028_44400 [Mycobacterium kiyosense]GLB92521.1 hypothetical protein SRL2020130_53380 [Mycobacterium kiyosense]GLB98719.1 hypothetical protein SRL2020226_54950 [Mycobacterium kiyosense]